MRSSPASDETTGPDEHPSGPPAGDERAAQTELAAMEDRYRRAVADLENYRKRSSRELDRRVTERGDALLRDWLEVVDSVERAVAADPDGVLGEGLAALLGQMEAVLARHGVRRTDDVGRPFDPEQHEAVGVRETDAAPDRTVIEVLRSGYAADGRVLRPAQVVVARPAR
jgi:molecular chaperone GrpE